MSGDSERGARQYRKLAGPDGRWSADPTPDEAELRAFYAEVYQRERPSASYQAAYDAAELEHKRLIARQIVYAVDQARAAAPPGRLPAPPGRLLEIGCGEGFVLAAARNAGWDVAGMELSTQGLETFHPDLAPCVRIADVNDGLAALAAAGERFDAVVLQNVLEHVRAPEQALAGASAVLAPGGAVSVTLPNDESPLQKLLRESGRVDHDYWFVPPQHLHYFSIAAGQAFARACGWRVVDLYSDFPIEFYLLHPGSNYVADRARGPAAHRARVEATRLTAAAGMAAFHNLSRAQAACGVGRAFTMVLRQDGVSRQDGEAADD